MSTKDYFYRKLGYQSMLGAAAILTPIMGYNTLKSGTQGLFGTNTLAERYQYLQKVWEGDDSGIYGRCTNLAKSIFGSTNFSDRAYHLLNTGIYGISTAVMGYATYYAYNQINKNIKKQFDSDYTTCEIHIRNKKTLSDNLESLKRKAGRASCQYRHIKNKCSSEWNCTDLLSTVKDKLVKAKKAWKTAGNEFEANRSACLNAYDTMDDNIFKPTDRNDGTSWTWHCSIKPTDINCLKWRLLRNEYLSSSHFYNLYEDPIPSWDCDLSTGDFFFNSDEFFKKFNDDPLNFDELFKKFDDDSLNFDEFFKKFNDDPLNFDEFFKKFNGNRDFYGGSSSMDTIQRTKGVCDDNTNPNTVSRFETGTPKWVSEAKRILDLMGFGLNNSISKIAYCDDRDGFNAIKHLKDNGKNPNISCSNGVKLIKQIFNLSSINPTRREENSAYRKLMKVLHPDTVSDGVTNDWLTKMKAGGEYKVNSDIAAEAFRVASLAHEAFKHLI